MSSTLTATRVQTLPRVNLLPPEIEEARRFRRLQAGLAATTVAALAVVGGLYLHANGTVAAAEEELAVAQQQQTELNAEAAQYAEVPRTYAQVAAAEAQLQIALAPEIVWANYLADLSVTIPENVWLTSMSVTSGSAAVPATNPLGTPGIGTVTFEGRAMKHNDVATWLERLAGQKGYADSSFSKSDVQELDEQEYVQFSSTVTVTADALASADAAAEAGAAAGAADATDTPAGETPKAGE